MTARELSGLFLGMSETEQDEFLSLIGLKDEDDGEGDVGLWGPAGPPLPQYVRQNPDGTYPPVVLSNESPSAVICYVPPGLSPNAAWISW